MLKHSKYFKGTEMLNNNNNSLNNENNIKNVIRSLFPTQKTFHDFRDDSPKISKNVISILLDQLKINCLIENITEEALLEFIENNSLGTNNIDPQAGLTFSEFLEEITTKRSINSLIIKINGLAEMFCMDQVQASMISRLKKNFKLNTSKKRNSIRLLSIWLGLYQPELGWNYEKIIRLSENQPDFFEELPHEKEGVRIAFSLQAQGDILDFDSISWLKSELPTCCIDLGLTHINRKKISYSLSSAYLNIPKSKGPSGEPRLFANAIRDAIALAHQISVRWALSRFSNQQRSIVISITAGYFDQLDTQLQTFLSVKILGNTNIRLTDFARLCARVANVKAIFHDRETILTASDGTTISVWAIDYLWSFLYYDFIPELLDEKMLPTTKKSYDNFKKALFFPDANQPGDHRALLAMNKLPQDSMLSIEIAKVLVSRRMYYEANEVLSTILASNPLHVVARVYRMIIYRFLFRQEEDDKLSENLYIRGLEEFKLLERACLEDTEIFIESGCYFYCRSVQLIRLFRQKNERTIDSKTSELMDRALDQFNKAATISANIDMRADFWRRQCLILKKLMTDEDNPLLMDEKILDRNDIILTVNHESLQELGWAKTFTFEELPNLLNRIFIHIKQFENTALMVNFIPSLKCIIAAQFWNALPFMTVLYAKLIISALNEAIQDAEKLKRYKIGVYSNISCYIQIQTPEHFIKITQDFIDSIKNILNDDLQKDDNYQIDREKIKCLALPFEHFDEKIGSDLILHEN